MIDVDNLTCDFLLVVQKGAWTESCEPIFVPEARENVLVDWTFIEWSFQLVILVEMWTELLNFLDWNTDTAGAIGCSLVSFDVLIRVGSEAPDFDFASTHGPLWVNDNGYPRSLLLQHGLSSNINAREPAPVPGMRVVPADKVLRPIYLLWVVKVSHHVLIRISSCVHSSLSGFTRQSESISHVKGVPLETALKVAHNLDITTKLRVHHHFYQSCSWDFHFFEVEFTMDKWVIK